MQHHCYIRKIKGIKFEKEGKKKASGRGAGKPVPGAKPRGQQAKVPAAEAHPLSGPQEAGGLMLRRPGRTSLGWLERQQSWRRDLAGVWNLLVCWGRMTQAEESQMYLGLGDTV